MADEDPSKKESVQKEEVAEEKKGDLSESDLDNVSGGVFASPDSTCPVCGGPPDHVHENR